MKTPTPLIHELRSCLNGLGVTAALVLFLGGGSPVLAQLPVGTWDCVISGSRQGTARLTFNADSTVEGFSIDFGSSAVKKAPSSNPRGDISGSRTGSDGDSGGSSSSETNSFGGAELLGLWGYDGSNKRIVGYIAEISTGGTNDVGFTGVIRAGPQPRLTLKTSSPDGAAVLRCLTNVALASSVADHIAVGKKADFSYTEFLTFSDTLFFPDPGMNTYDVVGTGPSYNLRGFAMRVRQGRLSLYLERLDATNGVAKITALTGPIRNGIARLKGTDGERIGYRLTQQP